MIIDGSYYDLLILGKVHLDMNIYRHMYSTSCKDQQFIYLFFDRSQSSTHMVNPPSMLTLNLKNQP